MNKNIILAGAVAIGIYLFSQAKKIPFITGAQRTPTVRQRTAQKVAQRIAQKVAEKVAEEEKEYIRERTPPTPATPMPKKIMQKIPSAETPAARRRIAEKIAQGRARRARKKASQTMVAARRLLFQRHIKPSLPSGAQILQNIYRRVARRTGKTVKQVQEEFIRVRKAKRAAQAKKAAHNLYRSSFPAMGPKNIVHITPMRQKIAQRIAQKVAEKGVAPWKVPLIWFPKPKFRVITPSDRLRNLAKKDIARKKAEQQKTAQKTTPITPSARRKKRLEALYGSHWHQVWIQRPRRR